MNKLLRAGVRRYVRDPLFYVLFVVTIFGAIKCGQEARFHYFDDLWVNVMFWSHAILLSFAIGREYGDGIFRNKVISGHSKASVFFSELLLGFGICTTMFMLFSVIFACFNNYIFPVVPADVLLRIYIDFLLVHLIMIALYVTVSCLIPFRTVVLLVNILLALGITFLAYHLEDSLAEREFEYTYDYIFETWEDANGNTHTSYVRDDSSGRLVENPRYIGGWKRTLYQTVYYVLPFGHVTENLSLINSNFGYESYDTTVPDWSYETSNRAIFKITEAENKALTLRLPYSVFVLTFVISLGFLGFRKKELK